MSEERAVSMARRLMSLPQWGWMPGMVTLAGDRVVQITDDGRPVAMRTADLPHFGRTMVPELLNEWADGDLPDLRDPATLGCLLHIVRNIIGEPCWRPHGLRVGSEDLWVLDTPSSRRQTFHDCEGSALLEKLEQAAREVHRGRAVE